MWGACRAVLGARGQWRGARRAGSVPWLSLPPPEGVWLGRRSQSRVWGPGLPLLRRASPPQPGGAVVSGQDVQQPARPSLCSSSCETFQLEHCLPSVHPSIRPPVLSLYWAPDPSRQPPPPSALPPPPASHLVCSPSQCPDPGLLDPGTRLAVFSNSSAPQCSPSRRPLVQLPEPSLLVPCLPLGFSGRCLPLGAFLGLDPTPPEQTRLSCSSGLWAAGIWGDMRRYLKGWGVRGSSVRGVGRGKKA